MERAYVSGVIGMFRPTIQATDWSLLQLSFSLHAQVCARVYVCVCVLSPLIRLSQSLCICMCVYVCEVCVLSLGVFVYKVCYSVKLIVFTSHL